MLLWLSGAPWILLRGLRIQGQSFAAPAKIAQDVPEIVERIHISGIQSQRLLVRSGRLLSPSLHRINQTKVVVSDGQSGIECQSLFGADRRVVQQSGLAQRIAQVAVDLGHHSA
jgi:hypothetical protein